LFSSEEEDPAAEEEEEEEDRVVFVRFWSVAAPPTALAMLYLSLSSSHPRVPPVRGVVWYVRFRGSKDRGEARIGSVDRIDFRYFNFHLLNIFEVLENGYILAFFAGARTW
jgi:hypothetical protein